MNPIFLTLDDVLLIHQNQLEYYGGEPGIRDVALLQSAINQPRAMFDGAFLHKDIYMMAAAYLFHITGNHPFIDGNKRVGIVAALVFFEINALSVEVSEEDLENLIMAVTRGEIEKNEIAWFFQQHTSPLSE